MPEPIVWNTVRLAIYGSSMFGSVIPAILVNTPGTPVNALITCDGFPMTQGGEACRVLGHACFGPFFSAILSILCLLLFVPVQAKVAPLFRACQILLAPLLGIALVVPTHRGEGCSRSC